MKYAVFDVETPNQKNDRMSAIGVSVVEDGKITGFGEMRVTKIPDNCEIIDANGFINHFICSQSLISHQRYLCEAYDGSFLCPKFGHA